MKIQIEIANDSLRQIRDSLAVLDAASKPLSQIVDGVVRPVPWDESEKIEALRARADAQGEHMTTENVAASAPVHSVVGQTESRETFPEYLKGG